MATATETRTIETAATAAPLPDPIHALLVSARRRIRAYVWAQGLAAAAIWLCASFWLLLALDWLFEPAPDVRFALAAISLVGLIIILYVLIVRRAFVPIPDAALAVLVERRFAVFGDSLVTAVEMAERSAHAQAFDAAMLAHTTAQAAALGSNVAVGRLFNSRPLMRRATAAVLLAASVVAFGMLAPGALAFWVERFTGSPEPWPRASLLAVEQFYTEFAVAADPLSVHVYHGAVDVQTGTKAAAQRVPAGAAVGTVDGNSLASVPLIPKPSTFQGYASHSAIASAPAVLRRATDVTWTLRAERNAREVGNPLAPGAYQWTKGTVELLMRSGATVAIEGPASIRMVSSHEIFLEQGRLLARAPTRSIDFVVRTSSASIRSVRQDTIKVVRGGDAEVVALAHTAAEIPDLVEVRYRSTAGARGREIMEQTAIAVPGRDEFQRYRYTFRNVLSTIDFDVVGGDDRVSNLRIEAVDSPKFHSATVDCRYPQYLVEERSGRFTPRSLEVAGPVEVPQGTHVTLRAAANKGLRRVEITRRDSVRSEGARTDVLELRPDRPDPERFPYELGMLDATTTLLVTMLDVDGIANREPVVVEFIARPDLAPVVSARPRGIGAAITPEALVRMEGELTDDYELARGWFHLARGEKENVGRALPEFPRGQQKVQLRGEPTTGDTTLAALDFREVRLADGRPIAPGDKLVLSIRAADRRAIAGGPNVAEGDRYHLDVVTPDELLALLEAREFILRERFETIVAELEQTRDGLSQLAPRGSGEAARSPLAVIERTLQNCQRSRHETLGVAAAFDDMRQELVSNRLDSQERSERLEDQIARPLTHIGDAMFPPLEASLELLRNRVRAGTTAATAELLAGQCRTEIDAILSQMRAVLSRMRELEDFNQLVDRLRKIIGQQEELNQKTQKTRRSDLED